MRLALIPLDAEAAERVARGETSLFEQASNAEAIAALVGQVAIAHRELFRRTGAKLPWIGYLAQDNSDGPLVGTCSFKGPPCDRTVEIAYFTFPDFQGLGWGRRMAGALLAIAWGEPSIDAVIAHTLPERNASARILAQSGFVLDGPVDDLEDGLVWRWSIARPENAASV